MKSFETDNLESAVESWTGEPCPTLVAGGWSKNVWGKGNKWRAVLSDCGKYVAVYNWTTKEYQSFYMKGFKSSVPKSIPLIPTGDYSDEFLTFKDLDEYPDHPYLVKKGISKAVKDIGLKLKLRGESLVIPCVNPKREIVSFQYIQPDGTKRFKANAPLGKFYCFMVYRPMNNGTNDMVTELEYRNKLKGHLICEGLATGISIAKYCKDNDLMFEVYMAFGRNNLDNTAKLFKKPLICADNDGINSHNSKVDCSVICPNKKGDYNDYPDDLNILRGLYQ